MIFTTLALSQLGHALAIRSDRQSLFSQGLRSNLPLTLTVIATIAVQLTIVYWGPFQALLDTEALSAFELTLVLVASTSIFWLVEAEKLVRRTIERGRASVG